MTLQVGLGLSHYASNHLDPSHTNASFMYDYAVHAMHFSQSIQHQGLEVDRGNSQTNRGTSVNNECLRMELRGNGHSLF